MQLNSGPLNTAAIDGSAGGVVYVSGTWAGLGALAAHATLGLGGHGAVIGVATLDGAPAVTRAVSGGFAGAASFAGPVLKEARVQGEVIAAAALAAHSTAAGVATGSVSAAAQLRATEVALVYVPTPGTRWIVDPHPQTWIVEGRPVVWTVLARTRAWRREATLPARSVEVVIVQSPLKTRVASTVNGGAVLTSAVGA